MLVQELSDSTYDGVLIFGVRNDDEGVTIERMRIDSTGDVTIKNGDLVIGTAGHGIDFSAATDVATGETVSGSILNDYEEGTWTPTQPTVGFYNDHSLSGHYQKIGNFVHFQFQCRFNNNSSGVNAVIDGLPFTSAESGANYDYGGSINYKTNANTGGVLVENGGTRIYIYNTGGSNMNCSQLSDHYVRVNGFLEVT